jgi:hypothetical protein
METPTLNSEEFLKLKAAAPAWVYRLMFPADRVVLESLNIDALFEWMGNLTRGNPKDVWDMYFLAQDIKPEYEAWIVKFYNKKACGSLWRRIRSIPARHKRGLPLWD